jgi:hypothetical protein
MANSSRRELSVLEIETFAISWIKNSWNLWTRNVRILNGNWKERSEERGNRSCGNHLKSMESGNFSLRSFWFFFFLFFWSCERKRRIVVQLRNSRTQEPRPENHLSRTRSRGAFRNVRAWSVSLSRAEMDCQGRFIHRLRKSERSQIKFLLAKFE